MDSFLGSKAGSVDSGESCTSCRELLQEDIAIWCPICHAAHHLKCYTQGGCVVFGCLSPKEGSQTSPSAESLAENVFRAELRYSIEDWIGYDETTLSMTLMALTPVFFLFLVVLT
jgi:hypothetical protein